MSNCLLGNIFEVSKFDLFLSVDSLPGLTEYIKEKSYQMHLILKKKEEFGSQIVSVVPYLLPDWYIARVNNRFYPFQDLGES